jgi:hypothetical protein
MTKIKFDIIKTRLNAPTQKLNFTWNPISMPKIKPKFTYRDWQRWLPAGQGHRNQLVDREGGYHSEVDPQDYMAIREWCEQNLKHGDWCTGVYYVILQREEDVAWFMLRWS